MSKKTKLAKQIEELVAEYIDVEGPGATVLYTSEGEVIHTGAYGLANLDGTPLTTATLFDLASVSKHVTGTAIAYLIDHANLDITAPVNKYVKELKLRGNRQIRVQDLLWHISGLPDYTGDDWDGTDEEFAALTPASHVDWLNEQELASDPGVEFVYNNSGYALLARVVECVSGESYGKFVKSKLFAPLGMKNSFALDDLSVKHANVATGYKTEKDKVKKSSCPSIIQGDGNIFTSIDELALWDAALRNGTLVSKKTLKLAWSNGSFDDGNPISDEEEYGYGFGWSVDDTDGEHSIFHNGSWMGTATSILRYIDADYTLAVLSNDENTDVDGLIEELDTLVNEE